MTGNPDSVAHRDITATDTLTLKHVDGARLHRPDLWRAAVIDRFQRESYMGIDSVDIRQCSFELTGVLVIVKCADRVMAVGDEGHQEGR